MILAPTLTLSAGSGAAIVRPTFSRDFAGEKTLNNGTGPAITFTRASDATYFDANGTLQTATSDTPRFDHSGGSSLGLLIEEQRTNSLRNSQAGGAVVGASGTAPTYWTVTGGGSGITREIAATGTENGLAYVDIRFVGTASADVTLFNQFEQNTTISASSGQTWTASAYFKLQAGSTSNISNLTIYCDELDNTGGFLSRSTAAVSPTASSLAEQRHDVTRTFDNASTVYTRSGFRFEVSSGLAIDITLRIAAPQLEQGAFATSYIPTTDAAATRAAESAVVTPISSFYNQTEGTLFAEASSRRIGSGVFAIVASIFSDDNNRMTLSRNVDLGGGRFTARISGSFVAALDVGAWTLGEVAKLLASYKQDDFAATINGASVTTDTSGGIPSCDTLRIGAGTDGGSSLNGHIRKLAYYPKRLSNELLQQLTT